MSRRRWPWFALQLPIIGSFLYLSYLKGLDDGQPLIGVFLIFGFAAAALATGVLFKIGELLSTLLARATGQRQNPTSDHHRLVCPWLPSSESTQHSSGIWIGNDPRKLIDVAAQLPPAPRIRYGR